MRDVVSHGRSDAGRVRGHNEDSYLCDPSLGLYIVADGMGGHAAGEIASALAVKAVQNAVREASSVVERFAHERATTDELRALLASAVSHANSEVFKAAEADPLRRGMGTTLTVLLLVGAHAFIAQVGDSRAYILRDGAVRPLTEDHSLVNEMLRRGKLTPDQATQFASRNTITRAVGILAKVQTDTLCVQAAPGDRFVLCSDGLHRYFSGDNELAPLSEGLSEEESTRRMVEYANARGGADNVTAVVLTLPEEGRRSEVLRDLSKVYDALSKLAFFHGLEARELLQVQSLAKLRKLSPGEVVLREGDEGLSMYVLLSGECSVSKGAVALARVLPGEHFGEMALVESARRSATVVAEGEVTLIEIQRTDLLKLLRDSGSTGVKLLWNIIQVLAARLRETSSQLAQPKAATDYMNFEEETAMMPTKSMYDHLSAHFGEAYEPPDTLEILPLDEATRERDRDTLPSPDPVAEAVPSAIKAQPLG